MAPPELCDRAIALALSWITNRWLSNQRNPKAQARGAAMRGGLVESLDDCPSVRFDHTLRCDVVGVGRQLDVGQPLEMRVWNQQLQRTRRVSVATLPRHD